MKPATLTAQESRMIKALFRVERAARRVMRYPSDRAPRESLSRALAAVDKAREEMS